MISTVGLTVCAPSEEEMGMHMLVLGLFVVSRERWIGS